MNNTLVEDFEYIFRRVQNLKEPETAGEASAQLALITDALNTCEKLLVYLAASESGREEMLTYLFEYKQLIKLERHISTMHTSLPAKVVAPAEPQIRTWWDRSNRSDNK